MSRIEPENMTRRELAGIIRRNTPLQTEVGLVPAKTHLRELDWHDGGPAARHAIVYRCVGCLRPTCSCNGADDDRRCDLCVVGGVL